ncbi:MAG: hypothetical protein AAFO69_09390, partial [Bacteroidota bacterium]
MKRSIAQTNPVADKVGGIILTDGNYEQVADFVRAHKKSGNAALLFYRQLSIESSVSLLNVEDAIIENQLQTASEATLQQYGLFLGYQLQQIGINGCLVQESAYLTLERQKVFFEGLRKSGLSVLQEFPEKRPQEVNNVSKAPRPRKQFESFALPEEMLAYAVDHAGDWIDDWLRHDLLIIDDDQLGNLEYFNKKVNGNKWYRKIAQKKEDKRIAWLQGYSSSVKNVAAPIWDRLRREFSRESFVILNDPGALPFRSLEDHFVLLGDKRFEALYRSMERYTPVSFFTWEQFDESPEEVLTELISAQQLIVGFREMTDIETIGQMLDASLNFTIMVDDATSLELLLPKGTVIYRSSDEEQEQNIAGQILFGGIGAGGYNPFQVGDQLQAGMAIQTRGGSRLAYDDPAPRGIDPEVLLKIDSIVGTSIQEGAFPGCQIAIVKDHAMVYEKSFGYFTYDSIYEVTPSHIYDL